MVATVAAVTSMVVAAVVALAHGPASGDAPPHAGKLFNACIRGSRFLVLARPRGGNESVEKIKDRARNVVVGEFTVFRSERAATTTAAEPGFTITGFAADDGRYAITTVNVFGRDGNAIGQCWYRFFSLAAGTR